LKDRFSLSPPLFFWVDLHFLHLSCSFHHIRFFDNLSATSPTSALHSTSSSSAAFDKGVSHLEAHSLKDVNDPQKIKQV